MGNVVYILYSGSLGGDVCSRLIFVVVPCAINSPCMRCVMLRWKNIYVGEQLLQFLSGDLCIT